MPPPDASGARCAPLPRRTVSLIYEALLLAALLLVGSLPVVIVAHDLQSGPGRALFQLYLVALAGFYFVWQWRHGRTLAMRTWRLRVVTRHGTRLTWRHALIRYGVALAGAFLIGAGFLWALLDRDGLFLHDRLAGTKIVGSEE
jgi:uncharacterized RDD family membrane protein YckC